MSIDRSPAAEGFYRHVEWLREPGVLVRITGSQVSLESGRFDVDYDERTETGRQFFLSRRQAVGFLINLGWSREAIVEAFSEMERNSRKTPLRTA